MTLYIQPLHSSWTSQVATLCYTQILQYLKMRQYSQIPDYLRKQAWYTNGLMMVATHAQTLVYRLLNLM
ncbi:MAG: hypothetical protein ACFBSF_00910, partial [Leptolyngbyaceae cyanobacterium]